MEAIQYQQKNLQDFCNQTASNTKWPVLTFDSDILVGILLISIPFEGWAQKQSCGAILIDDADEKSKGFLFFSVWERKLNIF